MNRILFEESELQGERLLLTGPRAVHIRNVLHSTSGDTLRLGQINGPLFDGTVLRSDAAETELELRQTGSGSRPEVDLILALPRPKVLKRLLPQIATLGVDRLFLCNASRVERYYFDCHVLEPDVLRTQLLEGLTQAGDTHLPEVRLVKRLRHFMEDECALLFQDQTKWLLHPNLGPHLVSQVPEKGRKVIAIGPEGGWIPGELEGFRELGFEAVQLGNRILRSDTATLVALGMVTQTGDPV